MEDERRTKKKVHSGSATDGTVRSGSGLKELLPKRAVWTKLDFRTFFLKDHLVLLFH